MKAMICPHCCLDFNQPTVDQIVSILRADSRRDIYEIGDASGKGSNLFTISYSKGQKMPFFSREVALAVEQTGIVKEFSQGGGWFRRVEDVI